MSKKVIICPNPKCQRRIEEPILLNILSTTPVEQYYACPDCFMKVNIHAKRANLVGSFLTALGLIILAWICCFTIQEITMGGKDIVVIFFGSRIGEAVSLGINMKLVYYFLIGLAFFLSGLLTFLHRRSKAIEPHLSATAPEKEKGPSTGPYDFGYLKKPAQNNTPVPNECIRCSRIPECSNSIEHRSPRREGSFRDMHALRARRFNLGRSIQSNDCRGQLSGAE